MPKRKTKSAVKKRFKLTGSGKVKFKRAFGRHILTTKNSKRKRRISQLKVAEGVDTGCIRRMLGIGK